MTTPFQEADLFSYQTINEVNCVPSLEIAACSVESVNEAQDSRTSAIWAVPLDGSPSWQLTGGSTSENTPRWSADGSKLAFLSDRKGMLQIYVMSRQGGEAQPLGSLPSSVMTIEWSGDGKKLLAICSLTVDPDLRGARPKDNTPSRPNDAPKVMWRLPYKADGNGYILNTEKHLFVLDSSSGSHTQLTDGPFNVKSAAWSPDASQIAFTRTTEGTTAHRTNMWIMDADGKNAREASHDVANSQYPRWAPDGSKIVFTGSRDDGDAQNRLWLYDTRRKAVSPLGSEDIEVVSGDSVHWTEDSSAILFVRAWRGRQEIVSLRIADGKINVLVKGDRQVDQLGVTRERLVYVSENACTPNEVYCSSLKGEEEKKLTSFNAWGDKIVPVLEARRFEVPNGERGNETIEGWLLRPPSLAGPYPLLVDVHGGPASYSYLKYTWHRYWHVLISQGWGVLTLNAVGSSSFGREFSDRLRGRWGELDLGQHLGAVKALQQEGIADERVAITGKSYGGYLAAWAIGHTSVFRAAVICAPVSNLETHYGTSDSGYYSDPYALKGEPHRDPEKYQKLSPFHHAQKANTPSLILQGEEDERCPKCQSEELYSRLKTATDMPVELVLYPGGSHHFFETGKPSHGADAVRRLVEWVNRWVNVGKASGETHGDQTEEERQDERFVA
jgi:dipeptidyl aminopeptidase/acylaminoacyl peptidase